MVLKDGKVAGWLSQWAFCRRYSTWGNRLKMDFMMIVFFVSFMAFLLEIWKIISNGLDVRNVAGSLIALIVAGASFCSLGKDVWSCLFAFRQDKRELERYGEKRDRDADSEIGDKLMSVSPSKFETTMEAVRMEYPSRHDFVYYYPKVTQMLLDNCKLLGVQYEERDTALWKRINEYLDDALKAVELRKRWVKRRRFFNEDKIMLRYNPELKDGVIKLFYARTCYYASYLTTEYYRDVERDKDGNLFGHLHWKPFVEGVKGEWALPEFDGANSLHLGVNTLAVTSDGYVLIWEQCASNAKSGGLASPSGSGSMDFEDIEESCSCDAETGCCDFLKVICCAAQRELEEEMFKRPLHTDCLVALRERVMAYSHKIPILKGLVKEYSMKMETKAIGLFRWGSYGGLPGFVCVTKLNAPRSELKLDLSEGYKVDGLNRLQIKYGKDDDAKKIGEFIDLHTEGLSIPLHVALTMLKQLIATREDFYAWLMTDVGGGPKVDA